MSDSEPSSAIRVALVDDHELFRNGLRELLAEQGFEVVGDAADGGSAIALVERTAPDVVVMDIQMPGMSGVEATRRIRATAPATRVLMLTVSPDPEDVTEAVLAGASGYVLKEAAVSEVARAVRAAARGEALLSPAIAARLLEGIRGTGEPGQVAQVERPRLTARELEVLGLIAAGKDNPEIAEALIISEQTVKSHVSNILAKLEVQNRIQAAVYAVRRRLV